MHGAAPDERDQIHYLDRSGIYDVMFFQSFRSLQTFPVQQDNTENVSCTGDETIKVGD